MTPGTILNRAASHYLGRILYEDGLMDDRNGFWRPFNNLSQNEAYYLRNYQENILTSILIYGGVHLLLPSPALQFIDLEPFKKEGIPFEIHAPYQSNKLNKLNDLFKNVTSLKSQIENNIHFKRVIRTWDLLDRQFSIRQYHEFNLLKDEYIYYFQKMDKEIKSIDQFSPILLPIFLINMYGIFSFFREKYKHYGNEINDILRTPDTVRIPDLIDLMDLDPSIDADESIFSNDFMPIFPTDYFNNFDQYDYDWGEYIHLLDETQQIDKSYKDFLMLNIYDPNRFFRVHSFWRTWLEVQKLMEISKINAATINLPIVPKNLESFPLSQDDTKVQLFKIYIKGINSIPRIENSADLFRLINHKYIHNFRKILDEWNIVLKEGQVNTLDHMRKDFILATKDLATVATMKKLGDIMTLVGLPVGIAGLLTGLPIDFGFTAVGPGMLLFSRDLEREAEWVKFGNIEF